jgi:hypothetical protein
LKQAALGGDGVARKDKAASYLAKLSCAAEHSDGAVASGIIQRIVDAPQKSDPALLLKRLRGGDCPGFKKLREAAIFELEAAVEKVAPAGVASAPRAAIGQDASGAAQVTGGPGSDANVTATGPTAQSQ